MNRKELQSEFVGCICMVNALKNTVNNLLVPQKPRSSLPSTDAICASIMTYPRIISNVVTFMRIIRMSKPRAGVRVKSRCMTSVATVQSTWADCVNRYTSSPVNLRNALHKPDYIQRVIRGIFRTSGQRSLG